ncbi:CNNM domain-containing protein [Yaniella halotolerans]|uniref:CNNM domain-containing protein n=1 Tax=Yaniella halotolerans TaxID=225453 RepID=UPI0003B42887|nr:hemolysin family protein [Yaniella halotolerans]
MDNPWVVVLVTVGIIVLSAFFVIMEFALLGARRHRLEDAALTSRSARAALWGIDQLTVMMAAAQLGITACTFALGAITKPAVDAWLSPLLSGIGLPGWLAGSGSFILSLLIVTFLHLVIGEMAPKSWAIAHPERAAMLTGLPAKGFAWLLGPLLRWINEIANKLVAASGVEPVDRAAVGGYDATTIRNLIDHSAEVGSLEGTIQTPLAGAIELETMQVEDLISGTDRAVEISAEDTVADLQKIALETGHKRILIRGGEGPRILHVRDTLLEHPERSVGELARPAFTLAAGTTVDDALTEMRQASEQLAVVMDGQEVLGVVTFYDAMKQLLPNS